MDTTLKVQEQKPPVAPLENIPRSLIEAVMDFIREGASGKLEIEFYRGGVGLVKANHVRTYKGTSHVKTAEGSKREIYHAKN